MQSDPDRPLIGVAQYSPTLGDLEKNRALARDWVLRAAAGGCRLLVLPECCLSGFVFKLRDDLLACSQDIGSDSIDEWRELARLHDIVIVGGFAEREGESVYNSLVLAAPNGDLVRYRKCHLFGAEKDLFSCGDRLVCYKSRWGVVGLAICYDLWFPEVVRSLAVVGASLVAVPANWFKPERQSGTEQGMLAMGVHIAAAAACSNELTIACCDRVGEENGVGFLGQSCILGPNGRPLAGPASGDDSELLVARWPDQGTVRSVTQSHLATRRDTVYRQPPLVVAAGAAMQS